MTREPHERGEIFLVEALALYHPRLIRAAGRVLDKHDYGDNPPRSDDYVIMRELREAVRAVKEETECY